MTTTTARTAVRPAAGPERSDAATIAPAGPQPVSGPHGRPRRRRRSTLAAGALLAGLAVAAGPAAPAAAAETLPCGEVAVRYGPLDVPSDVKALTTRTLRDRGRTATAGDGSSGLYVFWQSMLGAPPVVVEDTFGGATRVRVNPDASGPRSELAAALRELTPKCAPSASPAPRSTAGPTSRPTGSSRPTAAARPATPTRPTSSTRQSAAAAAPVTGAGGSDGPPLPWLAAGGLGLLLGGWWVTAPGLGRRREQREEPTP